MKLKKLLLIIVLISASILTGLALASMAEQRQHLSDVKAVAEDTVDVLEFTTQDIPTQSQASTVDVTQSGEQKPDVVQEVLKVVAVGDILLGRGVGSRLEKQEEAYIYAFDKVNALLKSGDIVFGNLEGPITDETHSLDVYDKKAGEGKIILKGKVRAFDAIEYAGFNMLSLANNHMMDYYDSGLYDTVKILDEHGVVHSGGGRNIDEARKAAIIEKKGIRVGMLAYTDMAEFMYKGTPSITFSAGESRAGVVPKKYGYIIEDVERLKQSVDILIVSFHWGKEESFDILPEQTELAHELVDKGVDVILGHHPHQFQGIEIYKGKPIIYSMGNFIFDQNDPENQESFIVNMEFTDKKLSAFYAIPVRTVEKSQVVPQTGDGAANILERELELSSSLNSKCRIADDKIVFDLN